MEEEDDSSTNACDLNLGGMVKGKEEVKEKGKEEDEMETDIEVEEVIEKEESEFKTDEEDEEIFEEEEEDRDDEKFNSFPTMKELSHHEWLLKNPQPSFAYECDFMILEDTTSIIDHHLGEMVFGRPFIEETGLVYNKGEGMVMFEQNDEKITFKMPHTMEIFRQTKLIGLSTDSIPPFAHKENFGMVMDANTTKAYLSETSTARTEFLQNILDLYFKYFKLSEDVANRILQVILDLQHFKLSLLIFAATILQISSAIFSFSYNDISLSTWDTMNGFEKSYQEPLAPGLASPYGELITICCVSA
ncbi:hypothetical protein Tco_1404893 [Tanacetum coccineum]